MWKLLQIVSNSKLVWIFLLKNIAYISYIDMSL